jgi:hypothetical protein
MDATARIVPAPPLAERPGTDYPEASSDPQGGGVACDATLTIRHEADEMWLALADQADASMGLAWYEQEPHICAFAGCCDERVAVAL